MSLDLARAVDEMKQEIEASDLNFGKGPALLLKPRASPHIGVRRDGFTCAKCVEIANGEVGASPTNVCFRSVLNSRRLRRLAGGVNLPELCL
jgi:hypothetical protein